MGSTIDCPARADYYGKPACFAYAYFEGRAANRKGRKADHEPYLCSKDRCRHQKQRREHAERARVRSEQDQTY